MSSDRFRRMTPLDVAAGWVAGEDSPPRHAGEVPTGVSPVGALERLLLATLQCRPCVVAFSGGRDSSVILAVAVRVARREGLPLPVPLTWTFPRLPETDESQWQELVLRQLGVPERVRLELDAELDLLGPIACRGLRRHGLLWPATAHTKDPLFEVARGGAFVTGEGGDEVFGTRRVTPLTRMLAREVRPGRTAIRQLGAALAPRSLVRGSIRRRLRRGSARPWLRPDAQEAYVEALAADALREPLRWDVGTRRLLRRRSAGMGLHNLDLVARGFGVWHAHPFLDPALVEAVAELGGPLGFPSRTAALEAAFGELLPKPVLRRRTKAFFNAVAVNRHSRAFIDRWSGEGVDADLVDAEALRAAWSAPAPHAGSLVLLQQAWLAGQPDKASDKE